MLQKKPPRETALGQQPALPAEDVKLNSEMSEAEFARKNIASIDAALQGR